MKKLIVLLIIATMICFSFSSCGANVEERGLKNFSTAASSEALCSAIIPEGFIDMFEYEIGDYHYSFNEKFIGYEVCDRAILYFQYDADIYSKAKAYAIENLDLSEEPVADYNGYCFFDSYNAINPASEAVENYPYYFVRFAYNNEKQTLIFIGFSVSTELYAEVDEVSDDFGKLLERYFGEFYSFE